MAELLTIGDVCRRLRPARPLHACTVLRWIHGGLRHGGRLRSQRIGGRVYIDSDELAAFLARCNGEPAAPPVVAQPVQTRPRRRGKRRSAAAVA